MLRRANDTNITPIDSILRGLADPIVSIDVLGHIEYANTAFSERFGSGIDLERTLLWDLFSNPARERLVAAVEEARGIHGYEIELPLPIADGRIRSYFLQIVSPTDGSHSALYFRDNTDQKRLHERLALLEYKDRQTGLPNRHSLDIALDKEISRVERTEGSELLAVLFISLENFARINQTYGHQIGDILLENTGLRIKESIIAELLRDSDYVFADDLGQFAADTQTEDSGLELVDEEHMVFRFDGRELTALITDIAHETDAAVVATRIARSVSMPYRDKFGSEIFVNCNIGISIYPNDGDDRESVIYHAASAMHEAKRLGEEFLLFNENLHSRALESIRLGGSIYTAFVESQFELYFHPVVDYTGSILGAEALIRWNHPDRGVVPPSEFIPLAEEKGIIVNIGKWALYNVASYLEKWPEDIYISLNSSPQEINHADLLENVDRVLERAGGIDPRRLKIEITERDAMQNPEESIRRMQLLADRGIDILIDDFGIGNSSLSYLKRLPASTLKVDKSFVDQIVEIREECQFLESIIELAASRNKKIIVEGVETEAQVALIRQMRPVLFQGYYFSIPLGAADFEELVQKRQSLPLE